MLKSIFTASSCLAELAPVVHEAAVLVMPYVDGEAARKAEGVLVRRALADGVLVMVDDDLRLGFIQAANMVYARSRSKYFGYLAQDAFPGDGWLKCALYTLEETGKGLLSFNDGRFHGNLAVFGLARRDWLRKLYHNLLFYPGYKRHFADTELSAIAHLTGMMIYNENCLLVEVDYDKHEKPNDPEDDALYRARARTGFGGLTAPFEPE